MVENFIIFFILLQRQLIPVQLIPVFEQRIYKTSFVAPDVCA